MRTIIPKGARLLPQNAERVFKGLIFDVYQWQQKMFDGSMETFEMLKRHDTINIFAIKDGMITVLNEEQPGNDAFIGLPGGRHDAEEEDELMCAKRELQEETGMRFSSWKLINAYQPYTKIDWFVYVYLATDFESQSKQKLDAGEKIDVDFVSFDELKRLTKNPKARYLQKEILDKCKSLGDLLNFPEYIN